MTSERPPLPPALTRLASALELSSGFLLYFITGPRDHADSVWLRLLALEPDFELVRHHLWHPDHIDLTDVLTGSGDHRPRIVFLSGLERIRGSALRKEISERLNLVRDSWAPHPARVVFWLPSWGLNEFRRVAPDLFDWRSGLITLRDADLPIRDELEYLVWACERHGGERRLLGGSRRWEHIRRRLDLLPRCATLISIDASERHPILRDIALGFARDALANPTTPREVWKDIDNASIWTYASHTRTPVPLLVRAQDAAGRFDATTDLWHGLAVAAGIPGPGPATVLAKLAAQGRLLVLLDGFDHLRLDAGTPARQWLERLTTSAVPVRLLAAMTGTPSPFFSAWPPITLNSLDGLFDAEEFDLAREYLPLIHLVQVLFPASEDLATLADYFLSEEADELRLYGSSELVATRLVIACARRGLLDAVFFAELARMRPGHAAEIEAVAGSLTA